MKKVILFDLDGTIVDSEPIHYHAHKVALKTKGISLTKKDYLQKGLSRPWRLFYTEMGVQELDEVYKIKEKEFSKHISKIKAFPEMKELIPQLSELFIMGVVTSASDKYASSVLAKNGLFDYFSDVVGIEKYSKGKPDPEPYLQGAKNFKTNPTECIVVEDSLSGVLSAVSAGAKCIRVRTASKFVAKAKFPQNVKTVNLSKLKLILVEHLEK